MELAQQSWLGGKPGSRRVIINRRGDIVEDVQSIRAPQEGRDLALVDRQPAAISRVSRTQGGDRCQQGDMPVPSVDSRCQDAARSSRWPICRRYNPNNRTRARDKMRNRALTDTFEPGSTLKPFTIAAALDAGKVRPSSIIDTSPGTLDDRHTLPFTMRTARAR